MEAALTPQNVLASSLVHLKCIYVTAMRRDVESCLDILGMAWHADNADKHFSTYLNPVTSRRSPYL